MKFKNKLIKGIAISMAFTTMLTSTAFATPIDLRDSVLDVQYDTLNQDQGTTYYTDENNEWASGTINEEVRVRVDLASKFDITIPKEIVLNGETGEANYIVNAKGDIAGDQTLVVEPENEFLLSEKGGKTDITATVTQENTQYTYTELQGTGTDYDGVVQAQLSAGEWSGKFKFNINFNETSLPKKGLSLNDYSWDEIAQISEAGLAEEYFNVGDEKTIPLKSTTSSDLIDIDAGNYIVQILGFNHDDLADGSGKAGITFGFKKYLDTSVMNMGISNSAGWNGSHMRTTYIKPVLRCIPTELNNVIKTVNKRTSAGYESTDIITTQDKIFLFSEVEITGKNSYSVTGEGSQYKYYKQGGSKDKGYSWWLRSPYKGDTHSFCYMDDTNYYNTKYMAAQNGKGIVPGFCI